MASGLIKRKAKTSATSRKKIKTGHLNANELSWKTVSTSKEAGITSDFDGILELEEVDNVEVVYEETEGGKIARFQVVDNSSSSEDENDIDPTAEKVASSSSLSVTSTAELLRSSQNEELSFDSKSLLSEWHPFDLHPRLLRTLYAQRFINPTPIQAEALPTALKGKDVVGVAETGSGKTLAYGLPILDSLLKTSSSRSTDTKQKRSTRALILTPTRELAFQVSTHLNACLQDVEIVDPAVKSEQDDSIVSAIPSESKGSKNSKTQKGKRKQVSKTSSLKPKGPPPVSVAAIVGGMSAQKQRRILDRGVDVLVATPGRLWDILQQDDDLASQIKNLRFLVLDEADRMIETGHFAELDNILRLTMRTAKDEAIESEESETEEPELSTDGDTSSDMQTFVFSATLSKDLQKNLKKRQRWHGKKKRKPASTLDDLVMRLDFRDPEPTVIDLSP
ncbi:hypothetical protein QCA50_020292 [Cerrena zonata]|uniref:Uncharacterized protein n=1 Tax=Cerrena zonata TaxID=2478898 RepID=A0AAW0F9P9_9APHY